METVLTVLHAGGKFGDEGGYKVAGGLHGVGVAVVNALSQSARGGSAPGRKRLSQRYSRACPLGDLQKSATTDTTGTRVTFKPDAEFLRTAIFTPNDHSPLRELAF